ncbi:MAG: DHH family phosphoesterase [Patescibacteria group bacterium]|nr:DHH family phosphoesterase [Patescibacteria group bacterium]
MTEIKQNFNKLNQLILSSEKILVSTHEKPDGDAIGSMLSLAYYFEDIKQEYLCFTENEIIDNFYFLPGVERIKNEIKEINDFDLIIFVDVGDVKRADIFSYLKKADLRQIKMVNIDHHYTILGDYASDFDLNIINLEVSSVSEIIYYFFDYIGAENNKEKATNLLTGILTDTGCFSNLGTTVNSFSVAANLLNKGANLKKICDKTMKKNNIITFRLWGRALSRLKKNKKTGVVTSIITQKDLKECGASSDSTEGISNFLNSLAEAKFTLLLKEEEEGLIKGSLRTTRNDVDVSKVAAHFGGGGHKKAAGFSVKGKLVETKDGWKIK